MEILGNIIFWIIFSVLFIMTISWLIGLFTYLLGGKTTIRSYAALWTIASNIIVQAFVLYVISKSAFSKLHLLYVVPMLWFSTNAFVGWLVYKKLGLTAELEQLVRDLKEPQ